MPKRRPKQLALDLRTWGGRRKGAGRPRLRERRGVPHRRRPKLSRHHPVHVTLRLRRDLPNMRTKVRLQTVRRCFVAACAKDGFRITDWSLQRNHLHLIAEGVSEQILARGIQGFSIRVAKQLNKLLERSGSVFDDRYHAVILKTPTQVRNAVRYVLCNGRKHRERYPRNQPDAFSSGWWFDGWRGRPRFNTGVLPPPTAPPQTHLRKVLWRTRGLIPLDGVPDASSQARTRLQ